MPELAHQQCAVQTGIDETVTDAVREKTQGDVSIRRRAKICQGRDIPILKLLDNS